MELTPHELEDVTRTVLGEAASEGYKGQVAVASVIANRMADNRFPGAATAVSKQSKKGWFQFSTWNAEHREGSKQARSISKLSAAYKAAEKAVLDVFQGKVTDPTKGAVNYYSPSGMKPAGRIPSWAPATEKQSLTVIGGHRFSGKVNDMAAYDAFWSRTPDPLSGYPASPIDVEYQFENPAKGLDYTTPTFSPGPLQGPLQAIDPLQGPRDGVPSFAARPDAFAAPTPTSRPSSVPGQVPSHAISGSPFGSVRGANTPSYGGIGSPGNATTRGAPAPAFSAPSFSSQIGSPGNATSRGMAPSAPSFSSQPATPMSRQQNLGTPADPMGVPSGRISGVKGITNPSTPAPTAPAFNPIPAADLSAYQQYARTRAPAIAPIAAPVVAPAPIAPPAKQPTFAEKMGKKAMKAAPAAILGAISPIAGALYGVAKHAGVFDQTGLFEPDKGLFAKDFSAAKGTDADYNPAGVLSAAQGAITPDTMQAHTTPSGAVNYSGASSSMPGWGAITNTSGVTTMSDPVSGVSATSGAGGGEGGGTVLCTYYHSIGWLDDETYAHDALYGLTVDQDALAGYHLWAVPLAAKLPQHKWLRRFLWYPVKLWAHSMAKPNALWSRVIRCFGEGICKLIARSLKPNMAVFPQRKGQNIRSAR